MKDEALTFSELRKIQKREKRQDELTELDDGFLLQVRNYLESKKRVGGEDREFRNARRVFEKIVSLREDKIVKNAKIASKSAMDASELEMLPFEQELFRELKRAFNNHRTTAEERTDPDSEVEVPQPEVDEMTSEKVEEDEEESDQKEDSMVKVKITSEVPEFMGTDLESYGPYEEGQEAEVPEENAEILVNRGSAEELA